MEKAKQVTVRQHAVDHAWHQARGKAWRRRVVAGSSGKTRFVWQTGSMSWRKIPIMTAWCELEKRTRMRQTGHEKAGMANRRGARAR